MLNSYEKRELNSVDDILEFDKEIKEKTAQLF